jgi:hypothetical protein
VILAVLGGTQSKVATIKNRNENEVGRVYGRKILLNKNNWDAQFKDLWEVQ